MKKTLLVALALVGFGVATSKADVAFSISFGNAYQPRYCAPAPVVVAPAPVVVAPAPVVVAPAPVVVAPPVYRHYPVVAQPVYAPVQPVYAPVVVQPAYPVYPSYGYYSYGAPSHCAPRYGRTGGSVHVRW